MFYILGEFVMVVYQERRVYISKNAGHTITDFNWLKWLTLLSHGGLPETKKLSHESALCKMSTFQGCVPMGWSEWGPMIPDHSDHTTSKDESKRGKDTSVHFMYYVNVVRFEYVILDHWSWAGSSLRKTPLSETCTWSRACARDHLPRDNQHYFRMFVMH